MHRWIVAVALTGLMGCGTTGAALMEEQQREGVTSASGQLRASVVTAALAQSAAIARAPRSVLGRFNPATCECPPYEVFLGGRWERVWLEDGGDAGGGAMAGRLAEGTGLSIYALQARLTPSARTAPNEIEYRVFELKEVKALGQMSVRRALSSLPPSQSGQTGPDATN